MRQSLAFILAAAPLLAHHSTAEMYDITKTFTIQGVITEVVWMNPHSLFFMDVTDADGKVIKWEVEMAPPNTLKRLGFNKEDFAAGGKVTIEAWVAKNGSHTANPLKITMPDGRTATNPPGWLNWAPVQGATGWSQVPK